MNKESLATQVIFGSNHLKDTEFLYFHFTWPVCKMTRIRRANLKLEGMSFPIQKTRYVLLRIREKYILGKMQHFEELADVRR